MTTFLNKQEINETELEFLKHSNWIEAEHSHKALEDAHIAWEYLKKQEDFTLRNILITHMLIMRRLNNKIAGKIRSCDVWVGGKKKIFTSQKLIEDDLKHLFDCMEASVNAHLSSKTAEDVTKHFHIEFEHIHPFTDGNGRIGRLILNKHRQSLGLPILIIHQGKEQYEYYKWFK